MASGRLRGEEARSERAKSSLERICSLLKAALDATTDGVLVVDLEGAVTIYNQRFLDMWRIPAELAATRDDDQLLRHAAGQLEDPASFTSGVRELCDFPERESFEVLYLTEGRAFERTSRPQRIGDEIVGRVWNFHDVTERERRLRSASFLSDATRLLALASELGRRTALAIENARALEQAREALRARDEFLSIAAHEIRGPITSIHLAVQTLIERGEVDGSSARLLEAIERADRRLTRFVDELLDVGRIQSDRFHFQSEEVNLSELVREVTARLGEEANQAGSPLSVAIEGEVIGQWDRFRLDQVVTNLLSNAIKFGQGKPIEVRVSAAGPLARLVVRDRGLGIAADKLERVFRPFERAVQGRQYGGLGLGLYIVRTIVEGLGGEIRVESELGSGSTFSVLLPLQRSE
jgi:signal transduction histidine kinase